MRRFCSFLAVVIMITMTIAAVAIAAGMDKEAITASAKKALENKGIALAECNIVYDENNKSWEEWGMYVEQTPNDKNHGYLPHGVLASKKYQAVYFDYIDDAKKDVWVFVDAETGDVLALYEKK